MKLRSDSNLAKLTEDQRAELFDWLSEQSYTDVIARAAKPAPDGFGIKFSRTTLQRFYEDFERARRADRLADLAVTTPDPQGLPSEILQLWTATRIQVAHATFDLALHAGRSTSGVPVNFDRVTRALHQFETADLGRKHFALDQQRLQFDRDHKTKQLDLKNRQFAFDQEKFKIQRLLEEFNIARELLKNAPEYLDILQRTDIDDENKVWLARERCYGPSPLAPYPPQPSIVVNRGDTIQATPPPLPATPDSVTQYNTLQHTSAESTPEICAPGAPFNERAVPTPIVDNRGDTIQNPPASIPPCVVPPSEISTPAPIPNTVPFAPIDACPDSETAFPSHPAVESASENLPSENSNLKSAIQPAPVRLDTLKHTVAEGAGQTMPPYRSASEPLAPGRASISERAVPSTATAAPQSDHAVLDPVSDQSITAEPTPENVSASACPATASEPAVPSATTAGPQPDYTRPDSASELPSHPAVESDFKNPQSLSAIASAQEDAFHHPCPPRPQRRRTQSPSATTTQLANEKSTGSPRPAPPASSARASFFNLNRQKSITLRGCPIPLRFDRPTTKSA